MERPALFSLHLVQFGTITLLLGACGTPEQQKEAPTPQPSAQQDTGKGGKDTDIHVLTLQQAVKPCERMDLMTDFDRLFGAYDPGGRFVPLVKKEAEFTVASLSNAVSSFKQQHALPATSRVGVLLHYGLDAATREFRTAVSITELKQVTADKVYEYVDIEAAFFMIVPDQTGVPELKQTDYDNWKPFRDDYFARVFVDRDRKLSTPPEKVEDPKENNSTYDAKWVAMDWDKQLVELINDNAAAGGTPKKMVVTCTAEDNRFIGGFHPAHYLIVHRRNGNTDLLADTPPNPPADQYLNRGANIGTPCPPRCRKYLVPIDGSEYQCRWAFNNDTTSSNSK